MLNVQGIHFKVTAPIRRHVWARLRLAMDHASGMIRGGVVRLRDINGCRGGIDKACRMVVSLHRRGPVVVEAVDRDLYSAIDAAAEKLREAMRRRLTRMRTLRRRYAQRKRR